MPAGTYDMILMDIQMPNMDGYEATRCIRHLQDIKKAEIPIIAMTANAFQEDAEKCIAVGMNAHLAKPLDIEKVEQTICKQLRDAKTTDIERGSYFFTVRFIVCYFPACSDMFWSMPENFMKIAKKSSKKKTAF